MTKVGRKIFNTLNDYFGKTTSDITKIVGVGMGMKEKEVEQVLLDLEYENMVRRIKQKVKGTDIDFWVKLPKVVRGKRCSNCRNGDNDVPADVFVTGKIPYDSDRDVPYRAFLCLDHLMQLEEDGAILTIKKAISKDGIKVSRKIREGANWDYVEALLRKHTGCKNAEDFLKGNPTIRPSSFSGANYLRWFYKTFTGKNPE